MEVKSYNRIYEDMRTYIIARQDKLTDFNEGSVLSSQIEATARELAMLYVRCRVGFSTYVRGLPYSIFGFEQKSGLRASVKLVFSRSKPFSYTTAIPVGTITAAGGLRFQTTELGSISPNEQDSSEIEASAEGVGEAYNLSAGMIKTIISTLPADIVSVKNPGAAAGGTQQEEWSEYINRFAGYILGLSRTNGYGFQAALTATELVRSLAIEEHFPPLDDLWNMTVYLEDGSGGMTAEALRKVKSIIDGDGSGGNGGYRAPGIMIRYLTPEIVPINVLIKVTADRDAVNELDESVIISEVGAAAKKWINALKIGQHFWDSDLVVALKRIGHLLDVDVEAPGDTEIQRNQIARFGSCEITVVIR